MKEPIKFIQLCIFLLSLFFASFLAFRLSSLDLGMDILSSFLDIDDCLSLWLFDLITFIDLLHTFSFGWWRCLNQFCIHRRICLKPLIASFHRIAFWECPFLCFIMVVSSPLIELSLRRHRSRVWLVNVDIHLLFGWGLLGDLGWSILLLFGFRR